jgi:putative ABC transport system permease protein
MRTFSRITSLLRNLFRKRHAERELDEEVRAYVALLAEEKIKAGMDAPEAHRQARIELGGPEQVKEQIRDVRAGVWLDSLFRDLRYAVRMLRKSPAFTGIAILTLALGIGANAAIFGLVDAALLRDLPFREPQRLVHVWTTDAGGDLHTPYPEQYLALRRVSATFEQVAATGWADYFYGSDESSMQNLPGILVTPNWLSTLGVEPFLGRSFLDEEQVPGRDAVVMLSYACWRARFHADPRIVGKSIVLNRREVAVVGVLPASLALYYEDAQVFVPIVLDSYATEGKLRVAGRARVQIVARLKPGVTLAQASSETEAIAEQLRHPAPADQSGHLVVEDFAEHFLNPGPTVQNARRGLWMMAVAAGVVLLIACANVASLLLARGVKRHREITVRAALGCSRGRMIRQLLTESTLLFLCGGSLGLLLARWSQDIVTNVASGMLPNGIYSEIDARALLIGLAVSFLSALFFGAIPALHATRVNLNDSLKDTVPNTVGGSRSRRPRNLLVVSQIALGMVLLVGFGLLFRSLLRVESAAMGYDPSNVLTAAVNLPVSRYAEPSARIRLLRDSIERARLIAGVESVGAVDSLPMDGADSSRLRIEIPSPAATPVEEEIWFLSASPGYFPTLKIAMLAGRQFRDSDGPQSAPVAIINQTFANTYFPRSNPIGYHLAFADSPAAWREIVGVVSDFRQRNPEEDARALAYFPLAQTHPLSFHLAIRVRASKDAAQVAHGLASWLRPLDQQLYWEQSTLQQHIHDSESLTLRRPVISLLAGFGGLALILSVVGIFGVTSYSVAERTREIGIRIALGATRPEVVRLVLKETLVLTVTGLAAGTVAALALTRFLPTGPIGWSGSGIYLYGISRTDSFTYSCVAILLAGVALSASYVPARRAMRVDPLVALRYE